MPVARVAKPVDQRLEVVRLPSPEKTKLAREIRKAGGKVPETLLPTRLGMFSLAKTSSTVVARKQAVAKAAEVAKQHKCNVRSVNRAQRSWIAYLVPEVQV